MTIRVWMDGEKILCHVRLDDAVPYVKGGNAITPLVLGNIALLKVAAIDDIIVGVGLRLKGDVYIVHELPYDAESNEEATVITMFLGTQYNGHIPTI